MVMMRAHPRCWDEQTGNYTHICQEPTGEECVENGCTKPAGTLWTPHWCPEHDAERQDRISARLVEMQQQQRSQNPQANA